jgi:hypothetical protein
MRYVIPLLGERFRYGWCQRLPPPNWLLRITVQGFHRQKERICFNAFSVEKGLRSRAVAWVYP